MLVTCKETRSQNVASTKPQNHHEIRPNLDFIPLAGAHSLHIANTLSQHAEAFSSSLELY